MHEALNRYLISSNENFLASYINYYTLLLSIRQEAILVDHIPL
jgi:hypothetical protein